MTYEDNYLAHYGIKGQKWGVRRFQNEDGTLTDEGKRRYSSEDLKTRREYLNKLQDKHFYRSDYGDPYFYEKEMPSKILQKIEKAKGSEEYKKLNEPYQKASRELDHAKSAKKQFESTYDSVVMNLLFPKKYKKMLEEHDRKIEESIANLKKSYAPIDEYSIRFVDELEKSLNDYSKDKREKILAYAYYCF